MKVLARLFRREAATEAAMPSPERSLPPPSSPARKLTPVPPAAALPLPPPLPPRRAPAPATAPAPALAVAPKELERSLDRAFDQIVQPSGAAAGKAAAATAEDVAAMQSTYLELAVDYCAPIRDVMLEVRWGEPPLGWLEPIRSAVASLRSMAAEVDLDELAARLERFRAVVEAALSAGAAVGEGREALLAAYQPLVEALPKAFELEGERDRREPIILRALLALVPDLSPLAVEKLFAAGL